MSKVIFLNADIVVVNKTFCYLNFFFNNQLYRNFIFRNIVMEGGIINSDRLCL